LLTHKSVPVIFEPPCISVACCVNFKVFLADLSTKNMTQNRFSVWVC